MVIRGGRATISEGKQTFEVVIRVNTAVKPKQIDTKRLSGPETTMPRRKGLAMIENSVVSYTPPARVGRAGLADSRMQEREMTSEMQAEVHTELWRTSQ